MDEKKEYPSIEETMYRMNGTLMNIDKSLKDIHTIIDRCNWNFGSISKKLNEK